MSYLPDSCLCAGVQISITDRFGFAGYIVAALGAAQARIVVLIGGLVDSDEFEITQEGDWWSCYASSENTIRVSCRRCGASLFPIRRERRLGILDDMFM